MARVVLLLLLVWTTCLPAAHAQRRVADCDRSDAATVEGVYQCMMSYRYSERDKFSAFEHVSVLTCGSVAGMYLQALQVAGAIEMNANRRTTERTEAPSCSILAQAVKRVQGKMPAWGFCTDYPNRFDARHMKECLTGYIPAYYGKGRTIQSLAGCQDAIETYERAIQAGAAYHEIERPATVREHYFKNNRDRIPNLPFGYERPACDALIANGIVSTAGAQPYRRPDRP